MCGKCGVCGFLVLFEGLNVASVLESLQGSRAKCPLSAGIFGEALHGKRVIVESLKEDSLY